MRFKERNFPHPVLKPIDSDVNGSAFQATCKVSIDNTFITVNVSFSLSNNTLIELIATNKAVFVVHAYCNATFFRKIFKFNENEGRIQISMTDVKRVIDLSFFVCSTGLMHEYTIEGMDDVYQGSVFKIQTGDILAYSEQMNFNLFDKDSLTKIASIMLIREGEAGLSVPTIEFDEDKIAVSLPPSQFALYAPLKADNRVRATLLTAVVLPVLIEAVQEVINSENEDDERSINNWYRVLRHKIDEIRRKPDVDGESAYYLAQSILSGISEKALKEIDEILTPTE